MADPFDVCPHGRVLCGNCRVFTIRQTVLIALATAVAAFIVGMATARAEEPLHIAQAAVGSGNVFNEDGANWCADAVVAWLGDRLPVAPSRSAKQLYNRFKAAGRLTDVPRPGDVVFFWRESPASWKGHVGVVESVTAVTMTTIEGNVGDKVVRRRYARNAVPQLLGYGRTR